MKLTEKVEQSDGKTKLKSQWKYGEGNNSKTSLWGHLEEKTVEGDEEETERDKTVASK